VRTPFVFPFYVLSLFASTHTEATLHSPCTSLPHHFLLLLSNKQRALGSNSVSKFCFLPPVTKIQPEASIESPPQVVQSIPTRKLIPISQFTFKFSEFWVLQSFGLN